ncbi:hypothetical protein [Microbispora sp. GKU 823]|uniref:hypothetical protein n=1 Tax=Microbispora sp. GKU 823 TaxID=1652100 RepID=UPI0011815951|nr:hypothetical protein [Microbispora sp. GKU 823]
MLRLVMTLLAVVPLLGGGRLLTGPRTFEEHAAQAVETWRTSGAAEIWRDGFVPVGDLTVMPPEVREQIEHDEEYGWVVAGPLPASPGAGQVRWDDGSAMRVPVIGPAEALQAVSPWPEEWIWPDRHTYPDGEAYKLTGAEFTTIRLETVRGMATVPAWRLHFSNLPGPIDRVAADQEALDTVKRAVGRHDPGDEQIMDVEARGERRLLVRYEYGTCNGEPLDVVLRVSEQPDVVVLGLDVPSQGDGLCAGTGMGGQGVVGLDRPLGDRVVLDAMSGLPVLCLRRAPDACGSRNT